MNTATSKLSVSSESYFYCYTNDVMYYVNKLDVRDAAYRFLYWADHKYPAEEKWQKIIEAQTILEKSNIIRELHLEDRLTAAKSDVGSR